MKKAEEDRLKGTMNLEGTPWELWKFYQSRADNIRSSLWTHGTWLVALMSGLLALAHEADVIQLGIQFPGVLVDKPWAAFVIALVGILLGLVACLVTKDHGDHMKNNWQRADYIVDRTLEVDRILEKEDKQARSIFEIPAGNLARLTLIMICWLFLVGYGTVFILSVGALLSGHSTALGAELKQQTVTILAMNDIYRIEGVGRGQRGGLARVRSLRRELEALDPEVLVLHAGDVIYPSLLSNSYDGAQMIDTLNRLDGDPLSFDKRFFVVFGNHEFDKGRLNQAYILADRVRESQFTWLRSNVSFATNTEGIPLVRGPNLQDLAIIEAKGIQIGIFGLTIDIARPQYVLKIHGAKEVARHFSHVLRQQGADLVVALTHLSLEEDVEILRALGSEGPDLIIGGHEHTRQEQKVSVQQGGDGRWVLKADADAVSTLIVHVTPREGQPPFVRFEYRDLFGDSPAPDADINREVQAWRVRHNEQFCGSRKPPEAASCLDEQVGVTAIELVAEERQIRSCETNFGNWIADQALKAFPKARVALINAGSLRLNQNIPPGPVLRRDLEELFPYDNKVSYIEIDDHTLRKAVNHAITGWPGNGRWLQVSGITFAYDVSDPRSPVAEDLNLSSPAVPGSTGGDRIGVVTTDYLLDPKKGDRDGYTMLPELQEGRETKSLFEIAAKGLAAAGEKGINPKVEGRIRQVVERPPCPPSP